MTPASRIETAMASSTVGVFTNTWAPMFMLPMSRLQISGRSSMTWRTRSPAGLRLVAGPTLSGSSMPGWKRAPGPVVRLISTSVPLARMRSTASR